uniref:Uncharacterized protein n=1 Tax=viral metagenome TaxID=1070528 RepID=A0A6C0KTE1_9ZZZZ
MNKRLLYSSTIIGLVIILISLYFYNERLLPLYAITYIGIITSIINHGITSKSAKNLDRFIMIISSIIYIYYAINIEEDLLKIITLCIVGIMMFLYIFSKAIKILLDDNKTSTNIHALTHCITLLPFCIIVINDYFYSKNNIIMFKDF